MKRGLGISLMIAVVLAYGGAVMAAAEEAEPASAEAPEAAVAVEQESAPVPVYGLQMWKDAETGELRAPTAKEAGQISALLQQVFGKRKSAPRVVTDKSGMLSIELNESMLEFTVMRKAPDGSLETDCVDDAREALELVGLSADGAGPEEE